MCGSPPRVGRSPPGGGWCYAAGAMTSLPLRVFSAAALALGLGAQSQPAQPPPQPQIQLGPGLREVPDYRKVAIEPAAPQVPDGFTPIFNGRDLTGWHVSTT